MATTATGIAVPAGSDAFDPQGDMVDLANSLRSRVVVPVPNTAARTALAGAVDWTPSAAEPLRVYREDAPEGARLEVSYSLGVWLTEGESATGAVTMQTGYALQTDTVAPTVRRQGNLVTLTGAQVRMMPGASKTHTAGTQETLATIGTAALRPAATQVAMSSAHAGAGTIVSTGEVLIGTDGTIAWRGLTTFTLGSGAANWIAIPSLTWRAAS